jgi:3-phenylpropionate/cinnamic acid dioxygenase small subunit
MEKKITKAQMFAMIKAEVADNADMVSFLDHEIELLDKKATYKKKANDKKQTENDAIKAEILTVLSTDKGMTSTEVM